ncbi:MAG TPA: carboxypeptidase-like regulatory domain-containing protein [Chthoniobacterales bacterium]|nr:carboxypeptidase-like regulatory domain-containing protein [Chthoniobacterales bacterium]
MKRKLASIFVLFAVKAGLGAADPATGTVHGTVYTSGSNGEQLVVPGAHVKLSGPSSFDIQADGAGSYSLSDVPPGVYSIEATAPGLIGSTVATIAAGETTETKVQLESRPCNWCAVQCARKTSPSTARSRRQTIIPCHFR